jgi:hypothetical protein
VVIPFDEEVTLTLRKVEDPTGKVTVMLGHDRVSVCIAPLDGIVVDIPSDGSNTPFPL